MEDVHHMHTINEKTREFTKTYNRQHANDNDRVITLTMELGQLHDTLVFENMKQIGYINHDNEDDNDSTSITNIGYYQDLINGILFQPKPQFSRAIGHVCGKHRVRKGSIMCEYYNMISYDGQHLCMKTFSGRIFAAVACLTRCAYNTFSSATTDELEECSNSCNIQYMSLFNDKEFKMNEESFFI